MCQSTDISFLVLKSTERFWSVSLLCVIYCLSLMACSLFCGLKQSALKPFFVSMHHISGRNFTLELFTFKSRLKTFPLLLFIKLGVFHLSAVTVLQLMLHSLIIFVSIDFTYSYFAFSRPCRRCLNAFLCLMWNISNWLFMYLFWFQKGAYSNKPV